MKNLGEKIREKRNDLGWSLDELARKSRVSKAYLSQLETGESERPSAEILYNIAIALELSIAELLGKKLKINRERDRFISKSLEKAAVEQGWSSADVKMLLGIALRTKKDLKPEDWVHIYETIRREINRRKFY